jgi:hypothetical protein
MSDLLSELMDDEESVQTNLLSDDDNAEDVQALKTQVEALEKEKQGLLAATKAERTKRQATAGRLEQLETAVSGILSQRQQKGMESLSVHEAAEAQKKGLPVIYDDDGNGWVDQDAVRQLVSPYEQKIMDLENKLQQVSSASQAQDAADKVREGIIGEDERYGYAASRYRAARKWVEDQVFDFAKENGVKRALTSGEALDYVLDKELRDEFTELFKNVDIVDVVTAEDSQDHFRRMLRNVADATYPKEDEESILTNKTDSRFQKVLRKPSNLGRNANAKAGQLSVMDRVEHLSSQDINDMSDKDIETLMKAIQREEKEDGIRF